ncbi:MAG: DUF5131 family protein [Erysipelotrichaceae bacterium]|nr:DUF5131 family protein [Erysipelotrichaceae bacterium]
MNDDFYNPWHGCRKYSEGCVNCYVYRRDEAIGKDASQIYRTASFDLPVRTGRSGSYKIPSGSHLFCCMTSDFFLEEADPWRNEIWEFIRQRFDVDFTIITKRISRFMDCVPADWGEGWDNVEICCTVENQRQCDLRMPVFLSLPIKRKKIICEPLLGPIDFHDFLTSEIRQVSVGGESGDRARECDYDWILDIRRQCQEKGIPFHFKQTGASFRKDGRLYRLSRADQLNQARKANIDLSG